MCLVFRTQSNIYDGAPWWKWLKVCLGQNTPLELPTQFSKLQTFNIQIFEALLKSNISVWVDFCQHISNGIEQRQPHTSTVTQKYKELDECETWVAFSRKYQNPKKLFLNGLKKIRKFMIKYKKPEPWRKGRGWEMQCPKTSKKLATNSSQMLASKSWL